MKEKIYISWNYYQGMVENLTTQLQYDIEKNDLKFDGVYGLPRGGLPLAVSLSHRLHLDLLLEPTEYTLIVDDISDTGEQLRKFQDRYIATLFTTDWTMTKPTLFVSKKLNKNQWIIFPWESDMEGNDRQTTLDEFEE